MTPIFKAHAIHREALAARALFRQAADQVLSRLRTAKKDIQRSLELLLAGRVNDPADFQTIAALTVEHSVVVIVDPATNFGTGGDLAAGIRIGSELFEGFPKAAHVAASLVLTEMLGSVLANLFEVGDGFGAEDRTTPHPTWPFGGKARL